MSILFKNAQIIDPTAEDVITNDLMVRDGLRDQVVELIFDMPIAVGGQGLAASFAEP